MYTVDRVIYITVTFFPVHQCKLNLLIQRKMTSIINSHLTSQVLCALTYKYLIISWWRIFTSSKSLGVIIRLACMALTVLLHVEQTAIEPTIENEFKVS